MELSRNGIPGADNLTGDLAGDLTGLTSQQPPATFASETFRGDLLSMVTEETRIMRHRPHTGSAGADAQAAPGAAPSDAESANDLVELHESTATLLASRGDYQGAYQHLRSALVLLRQSRPADGGSPIPEQLRREVDRLRRERAEAHEQSIRDSLTASYNRRYLDERLTTLLGDRHASAPGVAVVLIDLDLFKRVNDTFGHLVGDRVLQRTVELLCQDLPPGAFCARYGGEEFILVLPRIDAQSAVHIAESARARVAAHPWARLMPGLRVTISAGVAHEPTTRTAHGYPPIDAELQLLRADGLLYTAKQSGRNAVAYRTLTGVHVLGESSVRRNVTQSRGRDNTE